MRKSKKHYMEKRWNAVLNININNNDWKNIYLRKIKGIPDSKLSEFNYKILFNILTTGNTLCKWKNNVSGKCSVCNDIDTISSFVQL